MIKMRDLLLRMTLLRIRRMHLVRGSTVCQCCPSSTSARNRDNVFCPGVWGTMHPRIIPELGVGLIGGSSFHDSSTGIATPPLAVMDARLHVSHPISPSTSASSLPRYTRLDTTTIPRRTHLWLLILDNLLDLFSLCISDTHEVPVLPLSELMNSIEYSL